MSGGSGGVDGDNFGVWAMNAPPPLRAPCCPFPHQSNPSTARAACLPMSGGVDGDDFGRLMPSVPPRQSDSSTAHAAHPPMSGSGGGIDGNNFRCVGDERASTTRAPDGRIEGTGLPRVPDADQRDYRAVLMLLTKMRRSDGADKMPQ
ncbi:hypothetical protein BC826DRAFT_1190627 [Russula brevipes]|nr:hypothetical protein BC826DRAFT_1190627 [Russula brevipes]